MPSLHITCLSHGAFFFFFSVSFMVSISVGPTAKRMLFRLKNEILGGPFGSYAVELLGRRRRPQGFMRELSCYGKQELPLEVSRNFTLLNPPPSGRKKKKILSASGTIMENCFWG